MLLDGSRTLVFDVADAAFDPPEPTRLASGYAQLSAVTGAALQGGARVLFNGHGADQIFGMSPYGRYAVQTRRESRSTAPQIGCGGARPHFGYAADTRGRRRPRPSAFLCGADALRPMGAVTGTRASRMRAGAAHVDTLRLSWEVFRRPRWREPGYPGKPFAREAFADWLPENVRTRRWKVGYDGLYRRGFARNADRLISKITHHREHLEALGVDSVRCIERLQRCKAFHFEHTEMLIAILSYCVWRETKTQLWNIVRLDATVHEQEAQVL